LSADKGVELDVAKSLDVALEPGLAGGVSNRLARVERERRFAKLELEGAGGGGETPVNICSISTYYNLFSAPGICFPFEMKNKYWFRSQIQIL
jgi:hypothetical protein